MEQNNFPPKAKQVPKILTAHGQKRTDQYYWMNDRENPAVINYLKEENAYYEKMTEKTQSFQKDLFEEMKSRIKLDDESVPFKRRGYWYYVRFTESGNYPLYCRKEESLQADEQVMFDGNEMAIGHDFFHFGGMSVSSNNGLAAFGVDKLGRRKYSLRIKNLETGELYPDEIKNTTGSAAWGNDNKTIYYTRQDEKTLRADKIYRHFLGQNSEEDTLVYQETDETFNVGVFKTKSQQYIIITAISTLSDEYWVLDADHPERNFKRFQERQRGLEHSIAHYDNYFYILTNKDDARNFKLMKTPVDKTGKDEWETVIPHREQVLLEGVDIFKEYLVLEERVNGLAKIRVIRWDGTEDYYLPFESETYTAGVGNTPEFDTCILRYVFNGLTTPGQVIDYNMKTREETVKKEQEVRAPDFDKQNYYSQRLWAKAADGTKIPISVVYKKGIDLDGSNPLLLYAYGSYGHTTDPTFSSTRLSLLDRGFVYAIAHVRGGEYLGRKWYEQGKLLTKRNTFTDFIACSRFLIDQKYTSPPHLYALGGSAGGMLMGGILNMAPELYNGVVAAVPFVDVLTTMLDDSIPLTTGEYDEWGNPNHRDFYDYIKSYSPYDNVEAKEYPNILVTTGFHDSQVQYWEPAKWVAKLREHKTDDRALLFHINMDAGHGGASGRFEALKELAEDYTFLLDLEGKAE